MTLSSVTASRFSAAAARYDERAHIQQALAVELAGRVRVRSGAHVADIGTGTGRLLNELKAREPGAVYVGVDASEGMLARAAGLRVLGDHARLPFKKESLDLVVSSSCYHWATDLKAAFCSAAGVLKPGGRFSVMLFGTDTLQELFTSLAMGSPALSVKLGGIARLPSLEDVCGALSGAGFSSFDFEREFRREKFSSIREILVWLRETGTNGLGRGIFIGKDALAGAEAYYAEHFDGNVSFEVIWLEAQK